MPHITHNRDEPRTSVSMRTGLMPKKGLIAIPGTISASGSDGLGLMQMPPVSENAEQNKADYWMLLFYIISLSTNPIKKGFFFFL